MTTPGTLHIYKEVYHLNNKEFEDIRLLTLRIIDQLRKKMIQKNPKTPDKIIKREIGKILAKLNPTIGRFLRVKFGSERTHYSRNEWVAECQLRYNHILDDLREIEKDSDWISDDDEDIDDDDVEMKHELCLN